MLYAIFCCVFYSKCLWDILGIGDEGSTCNNTSSDKRQRIEIVESNVQSSIEWEIALTNRNDKCLMCTNYFVFAQARECVN